MPTPALYINEFLSGLYTQRSPLVTPTTSQGLSTVVRTDVLAAGANVEISNRGTLVRRPGFTRYCSAAVSKPLNFHSFRNLSGTTKLLVDTPTAIYNFTPSAITSIFSKGGSAQNYFQTVGNKLFWCNGTDAKKYDGTSVTKWGVDAPVTAPTLTFASGVLSPKVGWQYVYVYRTASGHASTASPISASTLPQTLQNITVSGASSTDPQVTNVEIYRTLDGGANYYFLASIANSGSTWSYVDSSNDSALNNFIVAPLNHANDPPPAGVNNVCYHMGRLWATVDNFVYFAGGPDTLNGSPEEAWPSANVFKYPGKVTALAPTTGGLLVFINGDSFIIRGTDSSSFYTQPWQNNFGVASQNSIAQDGDLLFIYTSRRQLFCISSNLEEIGFAIGDQLVAGFDPALSYLTLHRSGTDSGLFISDGSGSIFRYLITKDAWATKATVVGGVGCTKSLSITGSDYRLVSGRATDGGYILFRDLTNWQDDGQNFTTSVSLGQIVIAPLGETVTLDAVSLERMPVGSSATVGVLLQEIGGSFTALPNPVSDPPLLPASTSIITQRHYLKAAATPLPQKLRHLQVQISFPAENAANEILGFALLKP